jgi:DNA modification methylase
MKPTPYYDEAGITIYHGDSAEILPHLTGLDCCVTDPPYGLAFMGKVWDYDVPEVALWSAILAALKPGAHLLAFAGTRTQHRMAVNIEDAGFEVRDMIAWVYGQGFPKSLEVSKAIDKRGGNSHLTAEVGAAIKAARLARRISTTVADRKYCGGSTNWTWYEGRPVGQRLPDGKTMMNIAKDWPELEKYVPLIAEAEREVVWHQSGTKYAVAPGQGEDRNQIVLDITAPATDAAKQWQGWGTALKPALEPITMARKPLIGTVAENVLQHGTGAINVDGCRIDYQSEADKASATPQEACIAKSGALAGKTQHGGVRSTFERPEQKGRFPANLIHDGSEEVTGQFPGEDDKSAARFFYCTKASKSDRGAYNNHPTVKPLDLMRYLCRLVCRPGGIVLDPFVGSGTTLLAARMEGTRAIGIERDEKYCKIAVQRLAQQTIFQQPNTNIGRPDAAPTNDGAARPQQGIDGGTRDEQAGESNAS